MRNKSVSVPDGSRNLAHLVRDGESWRFHVLEDHLRQTGEIAAGFAAAFGSEGWARLAGMWHDLGKYRPSYQAYLRTVTGYSEDAGPPQRVDHSTAGAVRAMQALGPIGRVIAYPIAGHHAGLADWQPMGSRGASLSQRLGQVEFLHDALESGDIPSEVLVGAPPTCGPSDEWVRV